MIEEILPNLYRSEIPLPENPLKWLNAYIIRGGDRFLIVDTGFNRQECLNAMNSTLQKLNVDLNKTDFFITHFHSDHMGLLDTLASENSKVYFNQVEAQLIKGFLPGGGYWQKILDVYIANGFVAEDARIAMKSHPGRKYSPKRRIDFTIVNDGDRIDIGDFHFRCLATPGHSPGHTCLYEEKRKLLVAGDHILFDITPNISYGLNMEDALKNYLDNLHKVDLLDVDFVLTGHRRLVHDLHRRVSELQTHHCNRLNDVLLALAEGGKNVYQIAPHIRWEISPRSWEEFPITQKWFAFGETLAHVKHLEDQGKVRRRDESGTTTYALS
jgi:glyoxylase-like metal-dependent hydrolase (beta-lactamase superfamily II)